jgi:protein SCO1/2
MKENTMLRLKTLWLVLVAAVALGAGLWLGQRWFYQSPQPPLEIAGIYLPQPKELDDFTLAGQDGQPVTRADFKGHWSFLYFGYTYCPDICPLTLVELNKLDQLLSQQGLNRDTAYLLVSVDPERDTPARLGEYVRYFNKKFQAATGAPQELEKLAKQLSVLYTIAPHQPGESYTVDHSSTVLLIDPDARLHAIFTPPHQPATMAADFAHIRQRYENSPSVKSK